MLLSIGPSTRILLAMALLFHCGSQSAAVELNSKIRTSDEKSDPAPSLDARTAAAPRASEVLSTSTEADRPNFDLTALRPAGDSSENALDDVNLLSDALRLTIKFENYTKLSGDYRVSAENTISIPALGVVSVDKLTCNGLRRKLGELVQRRGGMDTDISIEIADYRPIFVTGLVRNSGSYPWKPGMIVLHAETLAGGAGVTGGGASANLLAADVEFVHQQKAESDLKRVLASLARLKAEKKASPVLDVSERLIELAGPAEAAELIKSQSSVLQTRRSSVDSQFATLEQGAKLVSKELEGLRAQLANLQRNTASRRQVLQQIEDLYEKKLVRFERKLEEQSKVADLEEKEANVTVGIVRSEGVLLNLQRDIDNFKRERTSEIDAEIFKLEREAAQLEIDVNAAMKAQRKLSTMQPTAVNDEGSSGVHYEIFRSTNNNAQTFSATRFGALRPGDVVVVSAQAPGERMARNASGSKSSSANAAETIPSVRTAADGLDGHVSETR
jgi:exopolysaccharide production protein ExoF